MLKVNLVFISLIDCSILAICNSEAMPNTHLFTSTNTTSSKPSFKNKCYLHPSPPQDTNLKYPFRYPSFAMTDLAPHSKPSSTLKE
jgi:hypothetical protein